MEWLGMDRWPPYAAGIGIGILSWLTFLLSDRALGCSTAFSRTSGMIEKLFRGRKVLDKPYYRKFVPEIDWEWMLVLGMFFGALASSVLSGQFQFQWVPERWMDAFGPSFPVRWLAALAGGFLLGFGARWAGGCTSGHGISGTLQLVIGSWIATLCFFLGGVATAWLIFQYFPK